MSSEPFDRDQPPAPKDRHPIAAWAVKQLDDQDSFAGWVVGAFLFLVTLALAILIVGGTIALTIKFGRAIGAW